MIRSLDPAALDRFFSELVDAGFEAVEGKDFAEWDGPIAQDFTGLSSAKTMRLRLREGWPFRHPHLLVKDLAAEHTNAEGVVCLWREDDTSRTWMRLDGLNRRIAQWCEKAKNGFASEDLALDAYMGFQRRELTLATIDLDSLRPKRGFVDGDSGPVCGIQKHPGLIDIRLGTGPDKSLPGRWYYRERVPAPPRTLDELRSVLAAGQRRNFERGMQRCASGQDNALRLSLLLWPRSEIYLDALVIRLCPNQGGGVEAVSLQPAPIDQGTLLLRAGPDAEQVRGKRIVLFGCGAVGSHAGLVLAESGIGRLHLVDNDVLRPGDVVRHIGGHECRGFPKAHVLKHIVEQHAPWASVEATVDAPFDPDKIANLIEGADVVFEATGNAPFIELMSRVAENQKRRLISAALYQGGSIGRVRRQISGVDLSIHRRGDDSRYVLIPPDKDAGAALEIGCSAPINNAPPTVVAALAALAAQVAMDTLLDRHFYPDEVVEVYRPLEQPPFDRIGRLFRETARA